MSTTKSNQKDLYDREVSDPSGGSPQGTTYAANGIGTSGVSGGGSGVSGGNAGGAGISGASAGGAVTPDSYEEYLSKVPATLEEIKNKTDTYNENQYGIAKNAAAQTKANAYKYANEALTKALGYNQNQLDNLIKGINEQKTLGLEMAESQKTLLLGLSKETRDLVYRAAEEAHAQAYENADIERERGVIDARTSYAQNLAGYGKNAEAAAGMGLSGSGYGAYLNAQAYATQRAETQNANAQAAAVKRQADYVEKEAKMGADRDYLNTNYKAESEFVDRKYDIDTTYSKNLTAAQDQKLTADFNANNDYLDTTYGANDTYIKSMADADSAKLKGDYEADISYTEGLLQNSYDQAIYSEQQNEDRDKKYASFVDAVNSGTSLDTIKQMGGYELLNEAQKNELQRLAAEYSAKVTDDETRAANEDREKNYIDVLGKINSGALTLDQLKAMPNIYNEFTPEQIAQLESVQAEHNKAVSTAETESATVKFATALGYLKNGTFTYEELDAMGMYDGLNEAQLGTLGEAATTYEKEKAAGESDAKSQADLTIFNDLFEIALSGNISAEDMRTWALKNGLSDSDAEALADTAKEKYDASTADGDENAAYEAFAGMYDSIIAGASLDAIKLNPEYEGLPQNYKDMLYNAANAVQTQNTANLTGKTSDYANALAGSGVDAGTVSTTVKDMYLENLKNDAANANNPDYTSQFDSSDVAKAYSEGTLTQTDYDEIVEDYISGAETGEDAFKKGGAFVSKADAEKIVKGIYTDPLLQGVEGKKIIDKVIATYKKYYEAEPKLSGWGTERTDVGKNFSVEFPGGQKYDLQNANLGDYEDTFEVDKNAPKLFVKNGKIYKTVTSYGRKLAYLVTDRSGDGKTGETQRLIESGRLPEYDEKTGKFSKKSIDDLLSGLNVPSTGSPIVPSAGSSIVPSTGSPIVPSAGSSIVPSAGSSIVPGGVKFEDGHVGSASGSGKYSEHLKTV